MRKILIKNSFIITQNKKREQISNGFVVVKNNIIEKVAAGKPSNRDIKKADKVIDARNMIMMPGLVNAHVHLGESIFAGFFKGAYSLEQYLRITEELTRKTDLVEKGRKIIADYSLLNLMRAGITTICGGRTTSFSEQWGMRNVSAYMFMDSFKLKKFLIDSEKKFEEEYEKIKKTKLSYPALFIHSLNTISLASIKSVKKILDKYPKAKLIIHIAETKKQEQEIKNKLGKSSVKFLYQEDLLGNRIILIHGNWIDDGDVKLIKKSGASIVHCLSSNLKVADRTLDLKKMINNGIGLCIATDGVVTSGTFSVLDEAAKCLTYHNNKYDNIINSQKMLDLITIDAARVLGLEDDIGSIEEGKRADMIFVKKNSMSKEVVAGIIGGKYKVLGVIIDGKVKIWNNRLLVKDKKGVLNKFRTLTKRIKEETR